MAVLCVLLVVRVTVLREKSMGVRALALVLAIVMLVVSSALSVPRERRIAAGDKNSEETEVVHVHEGDLTGIYSEDHRVKVFAGIPYAAPPVGELRWKEPQAPAAWDGIRACNTFAPMSMQKKSDPIYDFGSSLIGYNNFSVTADDDFIPAMSEDSLYLNIWTPADATSEDKLPVLFYIHGGSLNSGQSYFHTYNGETLAGNGIIVVTIAYRLGIFGYLASHELQAESPNGTTGDYGLLDQLQALRWVNDNIAAFGGDSGNITIAGESAGASSVNALCVSPLAKGLFRRAVAESSGITPVVPYHTFRTMDDALEVGQNILDEFGCANIDELRQIPADKLVQTSYRNNEMTVDGYAIPAQPYTIYEAGQNNEETVLADSTQMKELSLICSQIQVRLAV